jgi:diguanylate cyclase (GGDEF)-like protein
VGGQGWQPLAIVTTSLLVITTAAVKAWRGKRPEWLLDALLGISTAAITLLVVADPTAGISVVTFAFAWVSMLTFYYLSAGRASLQLAWMAFAYGIGLQAAGRFDMVIWLGPLASLWAVASFVGLAKIRTDVLIGYLSDAATRDPLTALFNRRGFENKFHDFIAEADKTSGELSVLMGDVDYFKRVNDDFGHDVGDQVLCEVAMLLLISVEDDAIVARVGGEEFAVLLPGVDSAGARKIAEDLRSEIQNAFLAREEGVTMSFGVVSRTSENETVDHLIRTGSRALYAAKEMGRNRSVTYSDEVQSVLTRANIRREEQSRTHLATLLTLAEALDLRDESTAAHSNTVASYAEWMAIELGLEASLVERLRLAGMLHDIGKIGVPDSVLLKPGKLDANEWAQMRAHPEIGARLLNHAEYADIRGWVLAHHERPDGRGYPFGLSGDAIPLGARILSVADAYEAMTADRVYRKSLGHEVARQELHACTGTQFDADVVAAFLRVLEIQGIGMAPVTVDAEYPPLPTSEDEDLAA